MLVCLSMPLKTVLLNFCECFNLISIPCPLLRSDSGNCKRHRFRFLSSVNTFLKTRLWIVKWSAHFGNAISERPSSAHNTLPFSGVVAAERKWDCGNLRSKKSEMRNEASKGAVLGIVSFSTLADPSPPVMACSLLPAQPQEIRIPNFENLFLKHERRSFLKSKKSHLRNRTIYCSEHP